MKNKIDFIAESVEQNSTMYNTKIIAYICKIKILNIKKKKYFFFYAPVPLKICISIENI